MKKFILCFLFILPFSVTANVPPVSVEAYGKLPEKSMLVISPSGERLAYRDTSNGKDIVVVIDLLQGKMLAAADVSSVRPNNIYFIDDTTLIFVASNNMRILGFRGRHDISVAYSYDVETKNIYQLLTAGYGIYTGQSQLGSVLGVSDDHKYAYMTAWENQAKFNLYRVRLDKKSKPRILQKGTSDTIDFFLDDNDEVVARERFNNEDNLHRVESRIDDEWVEIFREETEIQTRSFNGMTPDKKHLVMLSQHESHGRWAYYTMALADGAIKGPLFSHENKDVETVLTDINRVVYGVKYSGFTPSYEFFDEKLNARMSGIQKALPNNAFTIQDYTPDWNNIVFYMDGEFSSGDYVLYEKGNLSQLTASRPDIPPEAVHSVVEYSYKARDGLVIPTLLTIPNGIEAKNLPAIMMPHGGPESYDKNSFDYLAQYFASQGYMVIQPQFRGSRGFGSKHLHAGRGQWGRKMQDDLTDAVLGLADNGKIDKDRVCIVGASYGGYAALAGAVFTPDLYKCVVSINGVADIEEMMDTEKRDYGSDHWVVAYWQDVISKGDVDEDHLAQISPINHVAKVKAAVLLIHGQYDEVVPIKQSRNMYDELDDADKDVTFLQLDKGDHHLSGAANRMQAMRAIDQFLKKHM
ncbi:YqiA/YcfP family alpha/beta fold hydrolase [Alteromonadaceae bacterium BrNp21-10]|nr:YqiA/YcfP family alpha/beta fold hydrolase [Alteromonadaceae bacterium BrNp21-10]